MRDIWKVLGGVVVGILAVTGVMAVDDEAGSEVVGYGQEGGAEEGQQHEEGS